MSDTWWNVIKEMESKYIVLFKKFFCHLNQQKIEKELEIRQIKKKTFDSDETSRTWKIFWFW